MQNLERREALFRVLSYVVFNLRLKCLIPIWWDQWYIWSVRSSWELVLSQSCLLSDSVNHSVHKVWNWLSHLFVFDCIHVLLIKDGYYLLERLTLIYGKLGWILKVSEGWRVNLRILEGKLHQLQCLLINFVFFGMLLICCRPWQLVIGGVRKWFKQLGNHELIKRELQLHLRLQLRHMSEKYWQILSTQRNQILTLDQCSLQCKIFKKLFKSHHFLLQLVLNLG